MLPRALIRFKSAMAKTPPSSTPPSSIPSSSSSSKTPEITLPTPETAQNVKQVTEEGSTSAYKFFVGDIDKNPVRAWYQSVPQTQRPLVWTTIITSVIGMGFFVYYLTYNPELKLGKERHKEPILHNEEEGKRWVKHRSSMRNLPFNPMPLEDLDKTVSKSQDKE